MDERLWHQVVRDGNYEPLDADEAEAVAAKATALAARADAAGTLSQKDHRDQYTSIGYDIGIRGWDSQPPLPLAELGGLTINQLSALISRAIQSGSRYARGASTPKTTISSTPTTEATNEALDRIRKRLRERRDNDKES